MDITSLQYAHKRNNFLSIFTMLAEPGLSCNYLALRIPNPAVQEFILHFKQRRNEMEGTALDVPNRQRTNQFIACYFSPTITTYYDRLG